ncbi:MAG: HEAT repeat domain-containing protein [Planctomycetes bacterium]|nr:HEAT repeat domain-containing protein [Planctomycetota bacterium]
MTPRPALYAAAIGACCGIVGGALGGWLATRDPGRGRGAPETIRGDIDRLEAGTLSARADTADALQAVVARLETLERAAANGDPAGDIVGTAKALAADIRALRDGTARDLRAADARIAGLERRVDELMSLVALSPLSAPSTREATPTAEEEAVWVNLAQDADPMRRFSALAMLGRGRSDRSIRASLEALKDPSELVAWQAAQNLGRFGEHSAVRDLAALLRHDAVLVRHAAHEALRRLGAPDTGFDASALPAERKAAVEAIERWVVETQ